MSVSSNDKLRGNAGSQFIVNCKKDICSDDIPPKNVYLDTDPICQAGLSSKIFNKCMGGKVLVTLTWPILNNGQIFLG